MDASDAYRRPFMSDLGPYATALPEKHFAQAAQGDYSPSCGQLLQALHSSRVHQIELEMQNRELRHRQVQPDEERGLTQSCELRLVNDGERNFWVQMEASVTQDSSGATRHRVLLTDISDRIRHVYFNPCGHSASLSRRPHAR